MVIVILSERTCQHSVTGSVVRIAPNELCFITPSSYGDIYGHRKGHAVFCKSAGYDAAAFVAQTRSIVNERDPREHARMRRLVSPAFSERALRQQHPYVAKTADVLMEELGKRLGQPLDLGMWFALCTFDIVTNLSLGESLEALRAGKRHPWAVFFMNGARAMSDGIILIRSKLLSSLVKAFPPPQVTAMVKELRSHEEFTTAMVRKRQENPVDRDDIIGRILANQHVAEEEGGGEKYSTAYIAAQMSDFVIAGTDTTSVALSTATYYCLKNPTVIAKLKAEIRGRFARYEDITAASTTDLPYLNAVLSESMRIMPPVSWAASRVVPAGGDTVDGYFLPAGVSRMRLFLILL